MRELLKCCILANAVDSVEMIGRCTHTLKPFLNLPCNSTNAMPKYHVTPCIVIALAQ